MALLPMKVISNSPNAIAHFTNLPNRSGDWIMVLRGSEIITTVRWAWKYAMSFLAAHISLRLLFWLLGILFRHQVGPYSWNRPDDVFPRPPLPVLCSLLWMMTTSMGRVSLLELGSPEEASRSGTLDFFEGALTFFLLSKRSVLFYCLEEWAELLRRFGYEP